MKVYTRGIVRRAAALALVLALLLGVSPVPSVRAADQVVTNTNDSGPGSLRQAIADAGPGETITFDLTTPATITLTSGELTIDEDLTITGPGADQLTIDGNNASRVFYITFCSEPSCTVTVEISGLTIANGSASGTEDDDLIGGGIFNQFGSLTLTDVTFNNNTASENGGGMYNNIDSHPTLTNVTFSNNAASNNGGGMYNDNSSPDLTNVTFENNTASSGGGMYNNGSNPTLTNVTFSGNAASIGSGGGMHNVNNSNPDLTDVTFHNNTAGTNGGGMYDGETSPTLTNVTFSHNTAAHSGGGMYIDHTFGNSDSNPVLTNVTFSGNSADYGGGMYNYNSSLALTNVTFNGNTAYIDSDSGFGGYGGGVYNLTDSDNSLTLKNVILWDDFAETSGDEIYNYGQGSFFNNNSFTNK